MPLEVFAIKCGVLMGVRPPSERIPSLGPCNSPTPLAANFVTIKFIGSFSGEWRLLLGLEISIPTCGKSLKTRRALGGLRRSLVNRKISARAFCPVVFGDAATRSCLSINNTVLHLRVAEAPSRSVCCRLPEPLVWLRAAPGVPSFFNLTSRPSVDSDTSVPRVSSGETSLGCTAAATSGPSLLEGVLRNKDLFGASR
jgi:hypothetical protein